MAVVICPGFHDPALTDSLVRSLNLGSAQPVIVPHATCPPYSAPHVLQVLHRENGRVGLPGHSPHRLTHGAVFLSFSAGVVGAIGAAWAWQALGHSVKAFIAVDGWGIPLYGRFPIHRFSHDHWTHVTSTGLEWLADGFYADPPVPHLNMWRSPTTVQGWWVNYGKADPGLSSSCVSGTRTRATAAEVLQNLLERYEESAQTD